MVGGGSRGGGRRGAKLFRCLIGWLLGWLVGWLVGQAHSDYSFSNGKLVANLYKNFVHICKIFGSNKWLFVAHFLSENLQFRPDNSEPRLVQPHTTLQPHTTTSHYTCPQYQSTARWPLGRPLSSPVVPWETTEGWRLRVAARWPPGRPLRSPVAPREATGRRQAWQCCSLLGGPLGGHGGPRWSLGRPLGGDGTDPRTYKDFHEWTATYTDYVNGPFGLIVCCAPEKTGFQVQAIPLQFPLQLHSCHL